MWNQGSELGFSLHEPSDCAVTTITDKSFKRMDYIIKVSQLAGPHVRRFLTRSMTGKAILINEDCDFLEPGSNSPLSHISKSEHSNIEA